MAGYVTHSACALLVCLGESAEPAATAGGQQRREPTTIVIEQHDVSKPRVAVNVNKPAASTPAPSDTKRVASDVRSSAIDAEILSLFPGKKQTNSDAKSTEREAAGKQVTVSFPRTPGTLETEVDKQTPPQKLSANSKNQK